jgi:hypothetical protein
MINRYGNLALLLCIVGCSVYAQESADSEKSPPTSWEGDLLIAKLQNREFIIGTRNDAKKQWPLIGTRSLSSPVYANSAVPMTIQEQQSYVIYDRTNKHFIVYNIALCLKGKDTSISEKTDWVGVISPSGTQYQGDIIVLRKYDKKGASMRAPYYSMGRDYPMKVSEDGTCRVLYSYFGEVVLKRESTEVSPALLSRIVEDYDKHYAVRDNATP